MKDEEDLRRDAVDRLEILEAVRHAIDHRTELVALVADSSTVDDARARLRAAWGLTEIQSNAVLDMQVRQLNARARSRISEECEELRRRAARWSG